MKMYAVIPTTNPADVVAIFKDEEAATDWKTEHAGGTAVSEVDIDEFNLVVNLPDD